MRMRMRRDTHPHSQTLGECHLLGEPYSFVGLHYKLGFWGLNPPWEWDRAMGSSLGWEEIPWLDQEGRRVQNSPSIAAPGAEVNLNCEFSFMALVLQVLG